MQSSPLVTALIGAVVGLFSWLGAAQWSRRLWLAVVLAFFALGVVSTVLTTTSLLELQTHRLRSSAPVGGSYAQALDVLVGIINDHRSELGFVIKMDTIASRGELETIAQLQGGRVDMGLIQGDIVVMNDATRAEGHERIYALARLYNETFMLFTRHKETTLAELCARIQDRDLRTGSLGPGSQVAIDLERLLTYYNCRSSPDSRMTMTYREAADALADGRIDVAFMIAGYRQPVIRELGLDPEVHLLNLTQTDALMMNYGGWEQRDIPAGLFEHGFPAVTVSTVSTPAVLVVNGSVDDRTVYDLANFMFTHDDQIKLAFPQFEIDLPKTQTGAPIHPEAERAHLRQPLSWLSRYGPLISFFSTLTGMFLGVAGFAITIMRYRAERRAAKEAQQVG